MSTDPAEGRLVVEPADDRAHFGLYVRSRQGDAAAAAAFERYWRKQARVFLRGRFGADEMDELTSRFFERTYRLVGEDFHWQCPFTVYLRAILINISRDHLALAQRRRQREVSLDTQGDATAWLAADAPSPEAAALGRERRERIRAVLFRLAPVDRHIVAACLIDGHSGQDLAAELGMTRGALYQRLNRARQRLRVLFAEDGP